MNGSTVVYHVANLEQGALARDPHLDAEVGPKVPSAERAVFLMWKTPSFKLCIIMTESAALEESKPRNVPNSHSNDNTDEAPNQLPETVSPSTLEPPTYPKRLLPASLSSSYEHGLITNQPRTPSQQASFENRKQEILQTMSDDEIEARYQETVRKIEAVLREIKEGNERVDKEVEGLRKTRELERKVWGRLKGVDGK